MSIEPDDVMQYWLGSAAHDPGAVPRQSKLWYGSDTTVDEEIRDRFGATLHQAETHQLRHWQTHAEGSLALVILLDQFTRNLSRGTAEAWHNDPLALAIAGQAVSREQHLALPYVGRLFLYHPFHHAESLPMQHRYVELCKELHESVDGPWQEQLQSFQVYAESHAAIIQRFGRFPHRNRALGRTSTTMEISFLNEDSRTFGQ